MNQEIDFWAIRSKQIALLPQEGWGDIRGLRCINKSLKTFPRLPLTIATLALSLPLCISAHAVEVAQVPVPPNLPQPLPPPQDVVPPTSPPPQQPQVPSPPSEDLLPKQPAQPSEEAPAVVPEKFLVTKFEFLGGTVFKDEELLQTIEKALFAGGDRRFCPKPQCQKLPRREQDPPVELNFNQLLEARSAITQLYIDKGYITSGALIPAEQVLAPSGGAVKIQIAEGSFNTFAKKRV